MRRRALLAAASGLTVAALAGCVGQTSAKYDLTVRNWQSFEDRTFDVEANVGQSIRIEFQATQSHGASVEIHRGDPFEGELVFEVGPTTDGRSPTSTVEYEVDSTDRYSVIIHPCCKGSGGTAYAWVRIYVE